MDEGGSVGYGVWHSEARARAPKREKAIGKSGRGGWTIEREMRKGDGWERDEGRMRDDMVWTKDGGGQPDGERVRPKE